MPIGSARLAEPSPGIDVNLPILGIGFAVIVLLPLVVLAPGAVRVGAGAPGALGIAEPASAGAAVPAGGRLTRPGRLTCRAAGSADGVRARARARPRCRCAARWPGRRWRSPRWWRQSSSARASSGWSARRTRYGQNWDSSLICRSGPCRPLRPAASWRRSAPDRTRVGNVRGGQRRALRSAVERHDGACDRGRPAARRRLTSRCSPGGPRPAPREIALGAQTLRCSALQSGRPCGSPAPRRRERTAWHAARDARSWARPYSPTSALGGGSDTDLGNGAGRAPLLSEPNPGPAAPGAPPAITSSCSATGRAPTCPPPRARGCSPPSPDRLPVRRLHGDRRPAAQATSENYAARQRHPARPRRGARRCSPSARSRTCC